MFTKIFLSYCLCPPFWGHVSESVFYKTYVRRTRAQWDFFGKHVFVFILLGCMQSYYNLRGLFGYRYDATLRPWNQAI